VHDVAYGASKKLRWSYAAAKLTDEFTALAYHREKKFAGYNYKIF